VNRRRIVIAVLAGVLVLGAVAAFALERRLRDRDPDEGVSTLIETPQAAEQAGGDGGTEAAPTARRVSVTVRDRLSNDPVAGALVRLGGREKRTDDAGVVVFVNPNRSRYRVEVEAAGYEPLRDRVRFRPGQPFDTLYVWRPDWSWPVYGATEERTAAPPGIGLRPPLKLVWGLRMPGLIEFPPVTHNGIAYVTTDRGTLTAFRTEDGAWLWRRVLRERMGASPGYADQRVFVVSFAGQVRAFDARDGRLLWQRALGSSSESSPAVMDGRVMIATEDGRILALDERSGRTIWVTRPGGKITGGVARAGDLAVVGDYDGNVWAVRIADGGVVWRARVGGEIYAGAAVADGRVFVTSSTEKTVSALDARDGSLIWRKELGSFAFPAPAVDGGVVVTGSFAGDLTAWRAADGRRLWSNDLGERIYGAPQIVAGVAWASTFGGRTEARDLRSGRLLQRIAHGRYVPISGDARTLLLLGFSRIWGMRPSASLTAASAAAGGGRAPRQPGP
jgi:outer membrane protein assembly factor BamB